MMAISNSSLQADSLRPIEDTGIAVFESTWAVRELISYLCTLMYDLPNFCTELNGILQDLLGQYQLSCLERFRQLVRADTRGPACVRSGSVVLAAEWIQDRRVRAAIQASPAWQTMREPASAEVPDYVRQARAEEAAPEESEEELLLGAVGDRLLDKSDVLLDVQKLRSMGHLHMSMRWFAQHMQEVAGVISHSPKTLATMW